MDRTKHDITYHSETFDDKLDWFINDDVTIGFSVIGMPAMATCKDSDVLKKARFISGLF